MFDEPILQITAERRLGTFSSGTIGVNYRFQSKERPRMFGKMLADVSINNRLK